MIARITLHALGFGILLTLASFYITGSQLWEGVERGFPYTYIAHITGHRPREYQFLLAGFIKDFAIYSSLALIGTQVSLGKRINSAIQNNRFASSMRLFNQIARALFVAVTCAIAFTIFTGLIATHDDWESVKRKGVPFPFITVLSHSDGHSYSVNPVNFARSVACYVAIIFTILTLRLFMRSRSPQAKSSSA